MLLGGHEIARLISEGVPARFKIDGTQEEKDLKLGDNEKGLHLYPLINSIDENAIIEGASFDLRLGGVFLHEPTKYRRLLINSRNTGKYDPLKTRTIGDVSDLYILEPERYYLASTIESVNLPLYLLGRLVSRTTCFRSGLQVLCSDINPNYFGTLTIGLKNLTNTSLIIQRGFRIVSIEFYIIQGKSNPYVGNWQGGKVSTEGEFDPSR
jgi:deoxycytidine triphosphate deaminase